MKMALWLTALVAAGVSSVSDGNHFILCDPHCPDEEGWIATGSANVVRRSVETILLPRGKVLAAGGIATNYWPLSSAELYDPDTGGWSFTGDMQLGRALNTVTLLPNQRVLVTGGLVPNIDFELDGTRTAELYDPATGQWRGTGLMHVVRGEGHTATLLQNGQVLVTGGSYDDVLDSAELYDPATEAWSLTGSLLEGRTEHTATLLQQGKVLIAGGVLHFGAGNVTASTDLYDPLTGTWSRVGDLGTSRVGHTATALPDGRVLVVGGVNDSAGASAVLISAEIFDPATGLWSPTGSLHEARQSHTATLLSDGSVLVAGGLSKDSTAYYVVKSTEVYDAASGTWSQGANLNDGRAAHSATLLLDGTILVGSGFGVTMATLPWSFVTTFINSAERTSERTSTSPP